MSKSVALMGILLFMWGCNPQTKTVTVQGAGVGSCLTAGNQSGLSGNIKPVTSTSYIRWSRTATSTITMEMDNTFTFPAGTDDGSGRNLFEQMMKLWNDAADEADDNAINGSVSLVNDTFNKVANKDYTSRGSYLDGQMGIYKSSNWFCDVSSSALAITQYFTTTKSDGNGSTYNQLTHADIIVNYKDYNFRTTNDAGNGSTYDLVTVVLHELGHFVGLGHVSGSQNVMAASLSPSQVKRSLQSGDLSAIDNLYSEYDTLALTAGREPASSDPHDDVDLEALTSSPELSVGVVELRTDGTCHHYIDGKLISIHEHPGLKEKLKNIQRK